MLYRNEDITRLMEYGIYDCEALISLIDVLNMFTNLKAVMQINNIPLTYALTQTARSIVEV